MGEYTLQTLEKPLDRVDDGDCKAYWPILVVLTQVVNAV